jgi:regulator of replication initiation timing
MADEPKTDTPAPAEEKPSQEAKPEQKPQDKTFTQAELDRVVSDRLDRERKRFADYNDLKTKASQFDELQEENKSELEKLTGKVTSLTDENKTTKAENLRLRVALSKGLVGDKADLADRLRGATQEELEADADTLLSHFKTPEPGEKTDDPKKVEEKPPPSFDGGAREPAPDAKNPEQAHNELVVGLFGAPRATT